MPQRDSRTLQGILVGRVVAVSALACLALVAFFILEYTLDKATLRELTLRKEVAKVVVALKAHENPAGWPEYRKYPNAYGLRVFDHRTVKRRQLIAQANTHLLPPEVLLGGDGADAGLREGFGPVDGSDERPLKDRWLYVDHVDIGENSYWIQTVMVGDPGWLWQAALADEMRDHVLVPVLFIIPALAIVMLVTTSIALRPLGELASQAEALGRAVAGGGSLVPLPEAGLPREIGSVVAAINAMLRNLERSFRTQSQFTSDAAHELRTPLAVMLLEASHLPVSPIRDTILRDLQELADMVNQLLRFAQAEELMMRERQAVDIGTVARRVCEDLGGVAVESGIVFIFDAPDEPVVVRGQEALISSAIRNLLDNAIRFSPRGEAVFVGVDAQGTVRVQDRGPGIPDHQKELIFDRLWRSEGGGKIGNGIGLALVRRVTRLHGGDAWVEDRPGGGARFVLTFPPMSPAVSA